MTEFEMASLANDMLATTNTILTTSFTVTTGFVAASYLAAHRLSRTMTVIVVALYVAWSLSINAQAYTALRGYYRLLRKIRDTAQPEGIFSWFPPEGMPAWFTDARPSMIGASLIVAILASVIFFFHCRRVNRKSEAGAWKPKV